MALLEKFRDLISQRNNSIIKGVIIGIVIILSATAPFWLNQQRLVYIFGLLAGIAVLMFLLRWSALGFVLLSGGGLVIPFTIGTGSQTGINISVILTILLFGIWLLDTLTRKNANNRYFSRPTLPLAIFSLVVLLSFLWGQLPWFNLTTAAPIRAQLGGMFIFLLSFILFFLVGNQVRSESWLRIISWVFILVGAVIVFSRFFSPLSGIIDSISQPIINGSLFWTWLITVSFSQSFFNQKLNIFWRVAFGIVAFSAIFFTFILQRAWSSGYVPAFVGLVTVLWIAKPRFGLAMTIIGGLVALINAQYIYNYIMVGDNPYSLTTRVGAWNTIFEIVKVNPLFGLGPANYHFYTPLFPILGYSWLTFNSHNNYVDIVAQAGLIGLGCFFWFAFEAGRLGFRLLGKLPEGFGRAYVYGALGGLSGTLAAGMLGDWIIPFVYNIGMEGYRASILAWLFLGGIVTLERFSEDIKQTV